MAGFLSFVTVMARHLGFNHALDATAAEPKWQLVCPLNITRSRSDFGTLTFSREFLKSFVDNWVREGKPEKPWNYFHRGAKTDPQLSNEDKVAAGWIKDIKVDDEGLKLLTEWTPKAKAAIDAKELRYPSMEFHENGVDPKTGKPQGPTFYGCALTNNPFLTDLPPVQADDSPKEPTMLKLEQLIAIFGLSKDTTEQTLEAALKAKADELAGAKKDLEATRKELADATKARELSQSDDVRQLHAANVELAAKVTTLEKQAAEAATKAKAAQIDALIVELERGDGKHAHIIASQKPAVRDYAEKQGVEKAREFFTQFKAVALGERGANVAEGGVTAEEAHRQLQAKAAEIAKANPAEAAGAYLLACKELPAMAEAVHRLSEGSQNRTN